MSDEANVEEIKERIAQTRSDLGETVEALAAKADVKARAAGAVHEAVDGVKAKAHGLVDGAKAKAQDAVGAAKSGATSAVDAAKSTAQSAVDGAKDAAAGVQAKARDVVGRDRAADTVAFNDDTVLLSGEGALVTPARPVLDRRLQGVLMATALGAVIGAVIVWLSGRRG